MPFLSKIKNFFLWPKRELNWWVSNWQASKEFRRQLLAVVLGFGVAGGLIGWDSWNNLFNIFVLGFISGITLVFLKKEKKFWEYIFGGIISGVFSIGGVILAITLIAYFFFVVEPYFPPVIDPFSTAAMGAVIGIGYGLIWREKFFSLILGSSIGFSLGHLVSFLFGKFLYSFIPFQSLDFFLAYGLMALIFGLAILRTVSSEYLQSRILKKSFFWVLILLILFLIFHNIFYYFS
jgi:hypothetical protein